MGTNAIVAGIDLGTTYSAIAVVNDVGEVEILLNGEGENATPSVVLYADGQFTVGKGALSQAIARPAETAQCVKLQMGKSNPDSGEPVTVRLGATDFSPEEISARILRKLADDAASESGITVKRAVITVPAYFVEPQLAATRRAGELAGLEVVALLPEPEAAAVHFGIRRLADGESVLVCDLGGGTYDASILRMDGDELKAVKTRGSRELGGHHWTLALADMLAERIEEASGEDPRDDLSLLQHLCTLAEEQKRILGTLDETELSWSQQGAPVSIRLTADEFDECTKHLMDEVLNKTSEAVEAAGLEFSDLTYVLLVGGSSRLRKYADELQRITGKKPRRTQNPDEAIARGAAVVAKAFESGSTNRAEGKITIISGKGDKRRVVTLQRRTHHALGTLAVRQGHSSPIKEVLIPENSNLPASVTRDGFRIAAGQETFQVPIAQLGEGPPGDDGPQLDVQEILGNYRFTVEPVPTSPVEVRLQVEYDLDGIATARAFEATTGKEFDGVREPFQLNELMTGTAGSTEPGTVVLCIDCSGSMSGRKIEEAKQVLITLAEKYAGCGFNWKIAVVNFGGPYEISPSKVLMQPTTSLDEIHSANTKLRSGGGTPMAAGLENIRSILETASGKRLAILLTDGAPNNRSLSEQTAQTLKALQITIATVPIGSDADRNFLAKIGDLESAVQVDSSGAGMADAVLDLLQKM